MIPLNRANFLFYLQASLVGLLIENHSKSNQWHIRKDYGGYWIDVTWGHNQIRSHLTVQEVDQLHEYAKHINAVEDKQIESLETGQESTLD